MATAKTQAVNKLKKSSTAKKKTPVLQKYEDIHFVDSSKSVWNYSLFTEEDIRNYQQGTLYNAYEKFGTPYKCLEYRGVLFCCMGTQCHCSKCSRLFQ
jgi:hypothetical protein